LPSWPLALDRPEHHAHGIDHLQQRRRALLIQADATVAQLREQVLAGMRDLFEMRKAEEAAGALDRVDRAEDARERVPVVGTRLQHHELVVEPVQVLVTFRQEFADDVVKFIHRSVFLAGSARAGESAALRGSGARTLRGHRNSTPVRPGRSTGLSS